MYKKYLVGKTKEKTQPRRRKCKWWGNQTDGKYRRYDRYRFQLSGSWWDPVCYCCENDRETASF